MISGKSMSAQEYRKIDRLSASDIRTFAQDKKKFYKERVMEERGDEDEYAKSLLIGDIVHTKLLEPDMFDSKYFMSICQTPPTGNMLDFVESLHKWTNQFTDEEGVVTVDFETIARNAYTDSGYKLKFETIIEKFKGSNAETYFKEIRESRSLGKKVVTIGDITLADRIVETLKTHVNSRGIVNQESDDRFIIIHELQLNFEYKGVPMKCMLDKVVIDMQEQTIQIYDYKIVWDNVKFYREYYLYRRADIQAFIYHTGMMETDYDFGIDISGYTIKPPIFITADSTNFYPPLLFELTVMDLSKAEVGWEENGRTYKGVSQLVDELIWHQQNGLWGESKELVELNGRVTLNHKF